MRRLAVAIIIAAVIIPALADDATDAYWDAVRDAQRATQGGVWFAAGCLFGVVGVGAAAIIVPSPPLSRLLGKSPEYIKIYQQVYEQEVRKRQTQQAMLGCLVGTVLVLFLQ